MPSTLKIIACEIAYREICWAVSRTPNVTSLEFLVQGYHDNPELGYHTLQDRVNAVEPGQFDGILVGYGLCNHLITGLVACHTPLVIPRAHDCLTFFFGSSDRYQRYFKDHPGTFYYSSGWLEHRRRGGEHVPYTQRSGLGPRLTYEQLIETYGADNAEYLQQFFDDWRGSYRRACLIQLDITEHLHLDEEVQQICDESGWAYDEARGDIGLLTRWVDCDWTSEEFLVVPPGYQVVTTNDERIIDVVPVDSPGAIPPEICNARARARAVAATLME